ncbi:GAF domain-containing protein [Nonomuraea sp. NPDC005650]|uniref:GAF domain-containing protein n=1 Tax=Nonomuraea sp. NPDC005650 TaxID=3157045 RepID=UPI0033B52EAC
MDLHISEDVLHSAGRLFDASVHDEILRSTVRLARLAFSAAAASVFLFDKHRDALVFEAASGAGEDRLMGVALPCDQGIAGWVLNTAETIIVRDVREDPRFDSEFAAGTGYVPNEIMAAPLELEGEPIGVLEVLDPRLEHYGDTTAIDLLTELAQQACSALSLVVAARTLPPAVRERLDDDPLTRLGTALRGRGAADSEVVAAFVTSLADLLTKR